MTDTRSPTPDDTPEMKDPKEQPEHDYLPDGTPVEDEGDPGIAIDESAPPARGSETEHS